VYVCVGGGGGIEMFVHGKHAGHTQDM
jgi:hypothetical protein